MPDIISKTELKTATTLLEAMSRGAIVFVEATMGRNNMRILGKVKKIEKSSIRREGLFVTISLGDTNALAPIEMSNIVHSTS